MSFLVRFPVSVMSLPLAAEAKRSISVRRAREETSGTQGIKKCVQTNLARQDKPNIREDFVCGFVEGI